MALAAPPLTGSTELVEDVLRTECLTATETTKRSYRVVMRKFLAQTGKLEGWTAQDVKGYFASELAAGRAKAYLRWQYTVLRPLFSYSGTSIPVPRGIVRPPRLDERTAPALDPDEVGAIIDAAHRDLLPPETVALVAAATVWGFRRLELTRLEITPDGFLNVSVAKTGARRTHLIPDQLWPALEGYREMEVREVGETRWNEARKAARIRRSRGQGWHSVRRAVTTALWEAGVPGPTINAYMGWSPGNSMSASRYYRPRARDVDQAVYEVHPYLRLW